MTDTFPCPRCRCPLPADAPEGLCPACVLEGLAATQVSPPPHGAATPGGSWVDIGNLAVVAQRLPQYEILELLGRGGMGVVYKARQIQLDRTVAIKILPPAEAAQPDFAARFLREARALARLSHPNIVSVYDFGESGGLFFFAMEYVDGANLRQAIRDGRIKSAEALSIVPKICEALQYAHDEGVMHRDIKPENILLDTKGRVKIADFGLAKLLGREEAAEAMLTLSGMALGTPRYMAPEQIEKPESVDHRADIYSLGVVFYEMLTGELPLGRFALPSERVQVDVRLDEIVLRSLEKDVERRYQHASDVKSDVESVAAGGEISRPASNQSAEPCLSRLALWGALFTPLTLLFVTLLTFFVKKFRSEQVEGLFVVPAFWLLLTAGVGTTALGSLAIADIKRSKGRRDGLPLAAAAALFYPLLAFGIGTAWLLANISVEILKLGPVGPYGLIVLLAVYFAAWGAWRVIAGEGLRRKLAQAKPVVVFARVMLRIILIAGVGLLVWTERWTTRQFANHEGRLIERPDGEPIQVWKVGAMDPWMQIYRHEPTELLHIPSPKFNASSVYAGLAAVVAACGLYSLRERPGQTGAKE